MHRCLTIYDIVILILEFLDTDDQGVDQPRSVARVGQTCRTLFEPAMDLLWSTQPHLFNLTKCLQPDLWRAARSKDEDGNIVLTSVR